MKTKQTGLDFLLENLPKRFSNALKTDSVDLIEQAYKIERQEMIEMANKMQMIRDVDSDGNVFYVFNAVDYYEQTYGKENNS